MAYGGVPQWVNTVNIPRPSSSPACSVLLRLGGPGRCGVVSNWKNSRNLPPGLHIFQREDFLWQGLLDS